ncbi:MAG: septum formation initiator family protein [Pseudomonadota bacterium]
MSTRQKKNRKSSQLIVPAIAIAFISYFGYHAVNGGRGMQALQDFDTRKASLERELAALTKQREFLERKISLLPSHGPVVRDMLDERAREALSLSRPNEIVIFDFE